MLFLTCIHTIGWPAGGEENWGHWALQHFSGGDETETCVSSNIEGTPDTPATAASSLWHNKIVISTMRKDKMVM